MYQFSHKVLNQFGELWNTVETFWYDEAHIPLILTDNQRGKLCFWLLVLFFAFFVVVCLFFFLFFLFVCLFVCLFFGHTNLSFILHSDTCRRFY